MADATLNPSTEDVIRQINANMEAVLEFQTLAEAAFLAFPRRAINLKSWQVLQQAIQGLER